MKLTKDEVDGMNRAKMVEMLEDQTALEIDVIRKMTSMQMRKELMAFVPAEPKPERVEKVEKVPVKLKGGAFVPKKEKEPRPVKLRGEVAPKGQPCLCQCGGMTRGGRYLPGHDAKHHSNMNGGKKKIPRPCACGCEQMTRGGKFRPGHDARFYSAQKRMEEEEAKANLGKKAAAKARAKAAPKAKAAGGVTV